MSIEQTLEQKLIADIEVHITDPNKREFWKIKQMIREYRTAVESQKQEEFFQEQMDREEIERMSDQKRILPNIEDFLRSKGYL